MGLLFYRMHLVVPDDIIYPSVLGLSLMPDRPYLRRIDEEKINRFKPS